MSNGEPITTETFLVLCHECKLAHEDLETMTVGMVLDYIDEYMEMKNPSKKTKSRKASQSDFDAF